MQVREDFRLHAIVSQECRDGRKKELNRSVEKIKKK